MLLGLHRQWRVEIARKAIVQPSQYTEQFGSMFELIAKTLRPDDPLRERELFRQVWSNLDEQIKNNPALLTDLGLNYMEAGTIANEYKSEQPSVPKERFSPISSGARHWNLHALEWLRHLCRVTNLTLILDVLNGPHKIIHTESTEDSSRTLRVLLDPETKTCQISEDADLNGEEDTMENFHHGFLFHIDARTSTQEATAERVMDSWKRVKKALCVWFKKSAEATGPKIRALLELIEKKWQYIQRTHKKRFGLAPPSYFDEMRFKQLSDSFENGGFILVNSRSKYKNSLGCFRVCDSISTEDEVEPFHIKLLILLFAQNFPRFYVVVGGLILNRGVTLPGLAGGVFLRASTIENEDVTLQVARVYMPD